MRVSLALLAVSLRSVVAQDSCPAMQPICTSASYTFAAAVGTTSPAGPNYGCLESQPSPAWYYLEIDRPGQIDILMSMADAMGTGKDIDFAMWGPFDSLWAAHFACGAGLGAPISCSYSTSATETAVVPSTATTGQFYVLLLTNFANVPAQIALAKAGGPGTTDCSAADAAANDAVANAPSPPPMPPAMLTCDDEVVTLNFDAACASGPYHSNIGGVGPDTGRRNILFQNVGTYQGTSVDLKITSDKLEGTGSPFTHGYKSSSGCSLDVWGMVALASGWEGTVTYQMQDSAGNPLTLPAFYMTFIDIDTKYEALELKSAGNYFLSSPSNLDVTETTAGTTFTPTVLDSVDTPISALQMDATQKQHAVTFLFRSTSHFTVKLGNSVGSFLNGNRGYRFQGASNLVPVCPPPPPPPLGPLTWLTNSEYVAFNFGWSYYSGGMGQNNLGGYGPDSGAAYMLYYDVGYYNGVAFDLKVTSSALNFVADSDSSSMGYDSSVNGYSGIFGIIGLYSGWKATVTFQVQDRAGNPLTLTGFYFTFVDIDSSYEAVVAPANVGYILSSPSNLGVTTTSSGTKFTPTVPDGADNPTDPAQMDTTQKKHAVTFMYRATSSFTFTLGSSEDSLGTNNSRYYQFSGISSLVPVILPPPPVTPLVLLSSSESYSLSFGASVSSTASCYAFSIAQNNLGGYGPGSGAPYLLYYNVGNYMGAPMDLKIMSVSLSNAAGGVNTSPGGYASASTDVGHIGLYSGWEATVTFQIQDRAGNQLELPGFYFTFLGIDTEYKAITVGNGGVRYITSTDSNLAVTSSTHSTTFSSSVPHDVVDVPTDATQMNEAQQKHAVTLMYRNTSRFTVTLGNSRSSSEDEWKLCYYFFGGISNLVTLSPPPPPPSPPPFPPPPPCQTKKYGSCAGTLCCISPGTVGYYQGTRTTEWSCRAREGRNRNQCLPEVAHSQGRPQQPPPSVAPYPPPFPPPMPPA